MSDIHTIYVLDKIIAILEVLKKMQTKIDVLTERVTRLENAVGKQMEASHADREKFYTE